MCGFAGILGGAESPAPFIGAMGEAIRHRGPDDTGTFADGPVALVHRRLAIVDLSTTGHQPMRDASGRFVMVYNGEIYNHEQLRTRFLPDCRFRGTSDSETLVELFAQRGPASLAELNGIFAAAIWDRHERSLTLFRDGAGVKPLYVWRRPGGGMAFASELKALSELTGFSSPLDPVAAAAYVSFLWSPGERTMFTEVRKFPAGTWRTFRDDGSDCSKRFYALPDYAPTKRSDMVAIAETQAALAGAVARQMLADVEVGAFLSGGLDSSSIVHFARSHQPDRPMRCFTLAYQGPDSGELTSDLPYARLAAAHLGVDLHEISISAQDLRDLPELVSILDEPQPDPAAMGNLIISRAARQSDIKVLLSGAGGDDVFSGYRRHQQFAYDAVLGKVPASLRAMLRSGLQGLGLAKRFRRADRLLAGSQGTADERLLHAFEWLDVDRATRLLAMPIAASDVTAPIVEALRCTRHQPAMERLLRLDQEFFLRDHNLNYTDKTGMAAGVEIRVPFLDPELMAFGATLPTHQKLRGRTTKWALRKAMEPFLPHDVIYRPKTGFGVPLRAWLDGPLRDFLFDLTDRDTVKSRELFDHAAVAALRSEHYAGKVDVAYPLLALAMIELWCRRFADSR